MNDLPSWAVAVGTLALAGVTAWMAWKTRDVAAATRDAAKAAAAEAAATAASVEELRFDRELAWRPYLVMWVETTSSSATGIEVTLSVENVGRGPALDCFHAYISNGRWCRSPLIGVPAGEARSVKSYSKEPPIQGALFTYGQEAIDNVQVLVCRDGFADKLYRFIDGRAGFDLWRKAEPRPAWADAALVVEPQLAPK